MGMKCCSQWAEGNATGNNWYSDKVLQPAEDWVILLGNVRRPRRGMCRHLQTQLLIAQKEEQASTSGTQTDKAPVYDSDGSAEVHNYDNCYDNEIFNMFTQEEQYTELLEPIQNPHKSNRNVCNVISEISSVEQEGGTVDQHPATVGNSEKKKLKSDFKIREDELLDKQIQLENKIKELDNYLVYRVQSIQERCTMLSLSQDALYKTEQKMALGYQNPFYLKQAQRKQQSLYNGKVLLEKHDPPVVHDSEETLQLAQENFKILEYIFERSCQILVRDFKSLANEADESLAKHSTGIGVDNTAKTRRPKPKSNTKNDKVPSASKSSCIKNKEVEVEEHHRNLLLSKNKKHMSSKCNNIKLVIWNDKSEVVCAMCKQCLITTNHDVYVLNYVNGMNSHDCNQSANVSNIANAKS
ncbi:hypothetical protein Tco_0969827 [Tanacetum coccineum]